jgi:hypothetical protein
MADEVVVSSTLTQEMVLAGAELSSKLMNATNLELSIKGCMWFYDGGKELWKFAIVTPDVIVSGARDVYLKLHRFLDGIVDYEYEINWQDIVVFPDDGAPIVHIRLACSRRTGDGPHRIRYEMVSGVLIEDVLVYWMIA